MHFSSAMAVMARTLGIPSRIAVGYAPGSVVNVKDGQNQYEATSDDLHAWTEIYFEGVGWVTFEPTPGVGSATAFKEPGAPASNADDGEFSGSPRRAARDESTNVDSGATPTSSTTKTAPRTALITFAVLLVMIGIPALLRWARRRWRISRAGSSVDPLWRELEDTARDFGLPFSPTDTPRGFAARLRARDGIDDEALEPAAAAESREPASPAPVSPMVDGVDDLRTVIASLAQGASRQERLASAGAAAIPLGPQGVRTIGSAPGRVNARVTVACRRRKVRPPSCLASVRRRARRRSSGPFGTIPVGLMSDVHHVVVLLDLLEVDRLAEARRLEQVARVRPQHRHLGELLPVALEVAVVDRRRSAPAS